MKDTLKDTTQQPCVLCWNNQSEDLDRLTVKGLSKDDNTIETNRDALTKG